MLTKSDNDLVTQTGPGTPMGTLLREYWLPAMMSNELPSPDCPPIRIRLLNENLIAFRTTSGAIGIIQNSCPHRGASMFFGRNEDEGLRCVYHGWKFDVTGACTDMPSEPAESNFKNKVRTVAYPCVERNGVIWTYMGERKADNLPPLPDIEPNMLDGVETQVEKVFRDCNWFQGLEGDIDTSHLAYLHLGSVKPENAVPGTFDYYTVADRPPEADTYYWRVAHYLFPFYTMIPTGVRGVQVLVRAWVPVDDDHMMFWSFADPRTRAFGQGAPSGTAAAAGNDARVTPTCRAGANGRMQYLPDTSDFMG